MSRAGRATHRRGDGSDGAERLVGLDVAATSRSVRGKAHEQLAIVAGELPADLLVVGSRGLSAIHRIFLAARAPRCMRHPPACWWRAAKGPTMDELTRPPMRVAPRDRTSAAGRRSARDTSRDWTPSGETSTGIRGRPIAVGGREGDDEIADRCGSLERMAHGPVEVQAIAIASALPLLGQIPRPHQVGQDAVGRTLGDAHAVSQVAHPQGWVYPKTDQDVGVVRQERPRPIDLATHSLTSIHHRSRVPWPHQGRGAALRLPLT
jgi:hypothetical protein